MDGSRKTAAHLRVPQDFRSPLAAAFLYFLLAASAILLTSREGNVAIIWPANAVLVAIGMARPQIKWWPILLAGFTGSVAATLLLRGPAGAPIPIAAANMVEVAICAMATRHCAARWKAQAQPHIALRFILWAGVAAPAISALLGAAIMRFMFGQPYGPSYFIWFLSDTLGLLIFTPFFYALLRGQYRGWYRGMTAGQRIEIACLLLLTALVATFVFVAQRPLLFIVVMPMMLIAFRAGQKGMKIASMIVAVIGASLTAMGEGPLMLLSADPVTRAHFLQIFLLAQLLTQWPVVAGLSVRDRLTQQLEESERSLRILAAQSTVLMLTFDVSGRCNKAVGTPDLLQGADVATMPGMLIEEIDAANGVLLRAGHEIALDVPDRLHSVEMQVADGSERWLEATFRALEDEGGRCPGTLMTLHDISVRKAQTIALARTAHTDSLTGLLNRAGFLRRLERQFQNPPNGMLSVALIDVDRFKLVNDNCGHQTGDLVLREIARRVSGELRTTDSVGRLGGDEFVVMLNTTDWDDAKDVCARLVEAVNAVPVELESGERLTAAISCGVARYRVGLSAEQLLNEADVALYEAKRAGRNQMVAA